jgi:hypothetical protein
MESVAFQVRTEVSQTLHPGLPPVLLAACRLEAISEIYKWLSQLDDHFDHRKFKELNGGIQMKQLTEFAGQNWLITPAALAVGESRPASIHDQKFLLVLSGVVYANLKGKSSSQWLYETLSFMPDMAGHDPLWNSGPLNWAISRFGIPKPDGEVGRQFYIDFAVEEWAPFASLSSVFNQDRSVNSGFAVDVWRPHHFDENTDASTHLPVGNLFRGIDVDVAVRDSDAWIYRVGYNITLLGKIVFTDVIIT